MEVAGVGRRTGDAFQRIDARGRMTNGFKRRHRGLPPIVAPPAARVQAVLQSSRLKLGFAESIV
jgi:hypothetical protein